MINSITNKLAIFSILIFAFYMLAPKNLYAIEEDILNHAVKEKMLPVVILEDFSTETIEEEAEEEAESDDLIIETDENLKEAETNEIKEEDAKEDAIELIQKSIDIMNYEIERDEKIVSLRMRIPALRKLRKTLQVDVVEKEKALNDLKLLDSTKLSNSINSLQKTIDDEKKIMNSVRLSTKAKRLSRFSVKNNIPVKKDILASLNTALSELK